jgi:hypothetical protein
LLFLACAVFLCLRRQPTATAHGALVQQAYVWQRAWTPGVREAVQSSSHDLSGYVILAAEVSFSSEHWQIARVTPDWHSLLKDGHPIGISLRIGPYRGRFSEGDPSSARLAELAASLVADARNSGVTPAEFQIDFDCAESKLDGYRLWLRTICAKIAPTPVTFTALPSWLKRSEFAALARASDGYVLQVHSLDRPRTIDQPMWLCDAAAAAAAVESAGRVGVPFRVALPTYGYLVAFDESGRFVGLSAEGPGRDWPAMTRLRTLWADPASMARLVWLWGSSRPACMTGVIWYRLPVADDALNWRMATLRAVMAGRAPSPRLRAEIRSSQPCLTEVELRNDGDADAPLNESVSLHWRGAELVAADGLGGFEQSSGDGKIILHPHPTIAAQRLAPGDRRTIGWVRLSEDKEVFADVSTIQH